MFYQTQLEQIAGSLTALKFDDRLHQCRKRVKILIYNHKLTKPVLHTAFNNNYLDEVQTAIGDWHDDMLAIALFSSDEAKDKTAVTGLKKQDSKLKKNIKTLTRDFYNQATTVVDVPVEQLG